MPISKQGCIAMHWLSEVKCFPNLLIGVTVLPVCCLVTAQERRLWRKQTITKYAAMDATLGLKVWCRDRTERREWCFPAKSVQFLIRLRYLCQKKMKIFRPILKWMGRKSINLQQGRCQAVYRLHWIRRDCAWRRLTFLYCIRQMCG